MRKFTYTWGDTFIKPYPGVGAQCLSITWQVRELLTLYQ